MTDRIDHVAEAMELVAPPDYYQVTERTVQMAQVHATLALVEQQRVANLNRKECEQE